MITWQCQRQVMHLILDRAVPGQEVVHVVGAGEQEDLETRHLSGQGKQLPGATVVGPAERKAEPALGTG